MTAYFRINNTTITLKSEVLKKMNMKILGDYVKIDQTSSPVSTANLVVAYASLWRTILLVNAFFMLLNCYHHQNIEVFKACKISYLTHM